MKTWIGFAAVVGFLAGMLVMAAIVTVFPAGAAESTTAWVHAAGRSDAPVMEATRPRDAARVNDPEPAISASALDDLRRRDLTIPVQGITPSDLHDTFNETRGGGRKHEALDIPAPAETPVMAVEGGTIAKLFYSNAGGITIYQFDPSQRFCYYYAHLQRYAAGLREGQAVKRGAVIGYVGTTGNAPRETPHLHFAIFKLGDDKRWWQGTPLDPYSVLK